MSSRVAKAATYWMGKAAKLRSFVCPPIQSRQYPRSDTGAAVPAAKILCQSRERTLEGENAETSRLETCLLICADELRSVFSYNRLLSGITCDILPS